MKECKHESESPMRETYQNRFGRTRYKNIWLCNNWECQNKRERENIDIICEEDGNIDTADDIRVINILSSFLGIPATKVVEKLKESTEENPIIYQDGTKFWVEEQE